MRRTALVLTLLAASAAAFADPQPAVTPDLALKTATIEASVVIDGKLATDPKLRAALMADARRALTQDRSSAEQERRSAGKFFRRWSVERGYALRLAAGPLVSILITEFIDAGGAHPNTMISSLLWDQQAVRMVGLERILENPADGGHTLTVLARQIRGALAGEKKARGIEVATNPDDDPDLKRVEAQIDTIGAPSLAPSTEAGKTSGLTFHFSPYDVGAYAEGSYVAFISWQDLTPLLRPQMRALFGGARPDSDLER